MELGNSSESDQTFFSTGPAEPNQPNSGPTVHSSACTTTISPSPNVEPKSSGNAQLQKQKEMTNDVKNKSTWKRRGRTESQKHMGEKIGMKVGET